MPAFGGGGEEADEASEEGHEVGASGMERHAAGFELGEVQQLIDEPEQARAVALHERELGS